jgi:signal transduction histidine kinase
MLAGGIAHDFNNMLTVIGLYLGMARADCHDPDVQPSLVQIAEAVGRAKGMAHQILTFSRHQDHPHQLVRLPDLIAKVLQFLRPSWPAGVHIVTDLPTDAGWIMANPDQIHQVLSNLFLNAVQAMDGGSGRLDVRVRSVVIDQPFTEPHPNLGGGSYVWLTVSDTGHGMDAATQRQIFEPFFTTKRTGQGTGLGLAIVHRIIKDHGASIRVSSKPGQGTSFQIFFAAQTAPGLAEGLEAADRTPAVTHPA